MLLAFSITPIGSPPEDDDSGPTSGSTNDSVSGAVAEVVRLVRASGLANETNAMFTNVEGEWDEVMALVKACVDRVAAAAPRVSLVMKIDYRPGHDGALTAKVEAVERHLAATREDTNDEHRHDGAGERRGG